MVQYPPFFYDSVMPKWLLMTFLFFLIGIPFVVLFILGLRILSPNIKKLSTATILTLFGLWLISLLAIGFTGIEFATSHAYDGTHVTKHSITYNQQEPLKIRVVNDDNIHYLHNLRNRDNAMLVNVDDKELKYSNNINIDVRKSETDSAYIEIKKTSEGKKRNDANNNAEAIKYAYKSDNNTIVFDAFFLSTFKNIWKDEEINAIIYIPEGTTIYFEGSSRNFLDDVKNVQNVYDRDMANHHFKMTSKGFDCLDCDEEDINNEDSDDWDSDNDDEVSFLFDSTINNVKAEFIISKNTTEDELNKLIDWFKDRKNIDIDIVDSKFNSDKTINNLVLEIDCNDGYVGSIKISNGTLNDISKGFRRLYNEEGALSFKTW